MEVEKVRINDHVLPSSSQADTALRDMTKMLPPPSSMPMLHAATVTAAAASRASSTTSISELPGVIIMYLSAK